ncbi:MAG TPA: alpha/beta fold hydrolase [Jiangellaceae bacterium]
MTDTITRPSDHQHRHVPIRVRFAEVVAGVHRNRWVGVAIAATVSIISGWLTAVFMPRGPITPTGVVVAMVVGFAVGATAGFVLKSRWAILLAPLVFVAAFEIARIGAVGPSVDQPDFSTELGLYMAVLGRGFHGLIQLLPMMVGAAAGAGLARRARAAPAAAKGWRRIALWSRRGVTVLAAAGLITVGIVMTRPGITEPISAPDGTPAAGSVAELATVELGGHEQTVLIRASNTDNPVLLYLSGGPGQSDIGYARYYMTELEDDFVFAVWDQRGSGTSYAELDPTETWTLDQAVADTVELANYLRDRFGQDKIYLFGNSWGSTLGVLAAQQHPELFHAYIGGGQMASQLAADQVLYQMILDYAAETGDTGLAEQMRGYGPPPYESIYAYGVVLMHYDDLAPYPKTEYFETQGPPGMDGGGAAEYGPLDKVNKLKAIADMAAVMYPQLQEVDFRTQVPQLDVPVYVVHGAHEIPARSESAREWFDQLQAPTKEWITFEDSGHTPQFEEFPRFRKVMAEIVLRHN